MKKDEFERLQRIEERVREIAEENGLLTTDILFEIVRPKRMMEAMAYNLPTNFSHWSFGRDYDRHRTIYDHTGAGIPFEVVWNFDEPKAFLVDTNPFALNVTILCHVYGHVDFFLGSGLLKRARESFDIARETREASRRFREYERRFGLAKLEAIQDSAMSLQWLEDPDPFSEDISEEEVREQLMELERAKLERVSDLTSKFGKKMTKEEIMAAEEHLRELKHKTPPLPEPDILKYIMEKPPRPFRAWEVDVIRTIRRQARYFSPARRTKLLNEGWATYWHVRIMRQLFREGLLTPREHGVFNKYHSMVLRQSRSSLNWYRTGLHLLEYVEERWNKGQFGRDYEDSEDPLKRQHWDTGVMRGRDKLFEVRSSYSDRMAIENFLTDEFIRDEELYIWQELQDPNTGNIIYVITEKNPRTIREALKSLHTLYGIPYITVEDGNYGGNSELFMRHHFTGFELDPRYEKGAMENIFLLWGKPVHLETVEIDDEGDMTRLLHSYDGAKHSFEKQ